MPSFQLITTPAAWTGCLRQLQRQSRFALDLEANSLYAYREQVCLIQISTAEADYIVDPLASLDLEPLGALIQDAGIEKVLHSAEYDLRLLKREFGWQMANLFDTMWAARILGYNQVGLANILEATFQVKLNKRYQKANWCQRPLGQEKLAYAQSDTHYLLPLRDHLGQRLAAQGLWAEAAEIFAENCIVEPGDNQFDPDAFWRIDGVKKLTGQQQALLKALCIFRDKEARRQNRPAFRITGNKSLLAVARAEPRSLADLEGLPGMTAGQIRRYGRRILAVARQARNDPVPRRPQRSPRPPAEVLARYERLRTWRKRRALQRGVESDVVMSRAAMWQIAQAPPPRDVSELGASGALGPWRLEQYGAELVSLLQRRRRKS